MTGNINYILQSVYNTMIYSKNMGKKRSHQENEKRGIDLNDIDNDSQDDNKM